MKEQIKKLEERNVELTSEYKKVLEECRDIVEQMFKQYTTHEAQATLSCGYGYTRILFRLVVEENEREQYIEMYLKNKELVVSNISTFDMRNEKSVELHRVLIKIAENVSYLEKILNYVLFDAMRLDREISNVLREIEDVKYKIKQQEYLEIEESIKVGTKISKKHFNSLYTNEDDKYTYIEYEITKITPKYFHYKSKCIENGKEYRFTDKQEKTWIINDIQKGNMKVVVE